MFTKGIIKSFENGEISEIYGSCIYYVLLYIIIDEQFFERYFVHIQFYRL